MITVKDTVAGSISNIQILGNTYQNPENLAEIVSAGKLREDGQYEMSISSCGKNLNSSLLESGSLAWSNGELEPSSSRFRSKDFVKVNSSTSYILTNTTNVFFYDVSKKHISNVPNANSKSFITPNSCAYIKYVNINSSDLNTKIQLEEGTVATPYEPYQESKSTISLPCELGNGDRLYYDESEKAWCVDKVEIGKVLRSLEIIGINKYTNQVNENVCWLHGDINDLNAFINNGSTQHNISSIGWCNAHKRDSAGIVVGVDSSNAIRMGLPISSNSTLDECKKYIDNNTILVRYKANTPTKIILPLSTQIALNSFFGTTHISVDSGEVQAKFKGRVPKSTQASIQSLSRKTDILSDRLTNIEGLKDSQNMRYETNTGMLVAEKTVDGVVKDWKVEGKTLVNLSNIKDGSFNFSTGASVGLTITPNRVLSVGGYYAYFDILSNTLDKGVKCAIRYTDGTTLYPSPIPLGSIGRIAYKLNPTKDVEYIRFYTDNTTVGSVSFDNIVILDSEYNGSYFEGLKSVGQDVDKIEISSVKSDGNLFDINDFMPNKSIENTMDIVDNANCYVSNLIFAPKNKVITTNRGKITNWIEYDINLKAKKFIQIRNFVATEDCYIRVHCTYSDVSIDNFIVNYGEHLIVDTKHKQHEKSILYTNDAGELVPVPMLREWDKVEEKNDKTTYAVNSGEVVLNGSESGWSVVSTTNQNDTIAFQIGGLINGTSMIGNTNNFICDRFKYKDVHLNNINDYGINVHLHYIRVSIKKADISTQDVAGFKAWLQANNVTVTYQLATPKTYDCPNLNLSSYANETMISNSSGAINPHMEFAITSHINELVKSNTNRINQVEAEVYKEQQVQNAMIFDNDLRLMDMEFLLEDMMPMAKDKINILRGEYMKNLESRGQTEFEFLKERIECGSYTDDYLERAINKYKKANRLTQEEYDILYDMIYPPIYEEVLPVR